MLPPSPITELCAKYAVVPYENLSKILAVREGEHGTKLLQWTESTLLGAKSDSLPKSGATCFPLCWALREELQTAGYTTRFLMAHRGGQHNRHCSLLLSWQGRDFLLDPGYQVVAPLLTPTRQGEIAEFPLIPNALRLVCTGSGLEMWTGWQGQWRYRFTHDLSVVSEKDFRFHWQDSYSWDMMRYPVLGRLDLANGTQYYFQKDHLLIRTSTESTRTLIEPKERAFELSRIFKLDRELIVKALNFTAKNS